ncbi:MAG TPA: hemolysin III family protein [Acidimicrobiales bacterium]|nr:hemolysin III family protein [Acidimicrobiales bacterium]
MSTSAPAPTLAKPLLRGWLHLVCFFLALPAAAMVVGIADSPRGRVGALVYAVGLVALFGVSGSYHRGRWSDAKRRLMQRLDHGTIFVMIAGSYTPLCLLALRGWVAWGLLAVVWAGAAAGFVLSFLGGRASGVARGALYIVLGWASVLAAPQLVDTLSVAELGLIAAGGLLFTIGAIFLATRWPDPFPRVFGYHEVWHVLVVAAVVCHFVAISSVVAGPPPA